MAHQPKAPDTSVPDNARKIEIVIGMVLILVSLAAIVATLKFPASRLATDIGPARFPVFYSVVLILLALLLIFNNLSVIRRNKRAGITISTPPPPDGVDIRHGKTILGILASFACFFGMYYVGYIVSMIPYLIFLMWLMAFKHRIWNPVIAIFITGLTYAIFYLGLNVAVPVGLLFE
ncbi:tripartite tricarboxylate transporter TctB family protein [Brenneria izadpanahii]|uniref:Tripartite tricarboxylate transporter TctB family protein n=1 Tax=Brenneria izadpanahii TaxID=2722756 RepID=A0ABX7UTB5_9GAMM|nr:tripartite tricarboxylate transporter TctB family protein [Brenneria izadpanahii]QTF08978.1 tripartite tricarboxylate transporter TctB family protein [Brenneria izadpanahii]